MQRMVDLKTEGNGLVLVNKLSLIYPDFLLHERKKPSLV